MTQMQCSDIQDRLTTFMSGGCSPEERAEIRDHLRVCVVCYDEAGRLEEMWGLQGMWEKPQRPPDMPHTAEGDLRFTSARPPSRLEKIALAIAFLAALVMLLISLVFGWRMIR